MRAPAIIEPRLISACVVGWALLAAAHGYLAHLLPLGSEDAYITFRYARNLAQGAGLVMNPGERVMGVTSAPWALWSALGVLAGDPLVWARWTSFAADAFTLWIVAKLLAAKCGRTAAWVWVIGFAGWPFFGAMSVGGMEMNVMLALIALAAWRRSGWSLALLALFRPEGMVAALVVALWAKWRARGVAALIVAAGLAALAWYYGSPVPQSVTAKAAIYGAPGLVASGVWWKWLVPWVTNPASRPGEMTSLLYLSLMLTPAIAVGAWAVWQGRRSPLGALIAGCLAVWACYVMSGATYFAWYFVVPLAGAFMLAAAGLPRIVRHRVVYGVLLLALVGVWTDAPRHLYRGRQDTENGWFWKVGQFLAKYERPGESVLLEPIGMIGWQTRLEVIDEVGLTSPEVMRRRLAGPGWYSDLVRDKRPEWIVIRRSMLVSGTGYAGRGAPFRSIAERDSLFSPYALVGRFYINTENNAMLVLRRES